MKIRIEPLVLVLLILCQFEVSGFPLHLNGIQKIANNAVNKWGKKNDPFSTNKYSVSYNANEDNAKVFKNSEPIKTMKNQQI